MKASTLLALGALIFWGAGATLAQTGSNGTISDGDVFFVQGASPTTPTATGPTGDFRVNGASGTDHLYQNWWWYRLPGETRESAFNSATAWNWAGNTGTLSYSIPYAGGNVSANFQFVVTDTGTNLGLVTETLVITNNAPTAPLVMNLFNYTDYDLGGSSTGDSAAALSPTQIQITDTTWTGLFEGVNANAYQVTAFSTLRGLLADAAVNDLNNTGLPFGPGDFTGAFQWTTPELLPGQSYTIVENLGIVPEPAALVVLALTTLFLRRR